MSLVACLLHGLFSMSASDLVALLVICCRQKRAEFFLIFGRYTFLHYMFPNSAAAVGARNAILVSRRQVPIWASCYLSLLHAKTVHLVPHFFFFDLLHDLQQGNPVLKHIKNVRWIYADIVPDYILGQSSCALYLRSAKQCLEGKEWVVNTLRLI